MNTSQLDFYFPFFVFFYGISLLFMMNVPSFTKIKRQILREAQNRTALAFGRKMEFAGSNFSEFSLWAMTIVSGLWSLQNLLFA